MSPLSFLAQYEKTRCMVTGAGAVEPGDRCGVRRAYGGGQLPAGYEPDQGVEAGTPELVAKADAPIERERVFHLRTLPFGRWSPRS